MPLDCKEKILSEDYIDFVIDFPLNELFTEYREEWDFCYQEIGDGFGIISINRNQLADTTLLTLDYHYFPDLLGLQQEDGEVPREGQTAPGIPGITGAEVLPETVAGPQGQAFDPSPLITSGITQVQDPPLNLTGRGVILAFADTGERVIIMSS